MKKISGFRKFGRFSVQDANTYKKKAYLKQSVSDTVSSLLLKQKSCENGESRQRSRFKPEFHEKTETPEKDHIKSLFRAKSQGIEERQAPSQLRVQKYVKPQSSKVVYSVGNRDGSGQKVKKDFATIRGNEVNLYDSVPKSVKQKNSDQKLNIYSKSNIKKQLAQGVLNEDDSKMKLEEKSEKERNERVEAKGLKSQMAAGRGFLDFKGESKIISKTLVSKVIPKGLDSGQVEIVNNTIQLNLGKKKSKIVSNDEKQILIKTREAKERKVRKMSSSKKIVALEINLNDLVVKGEHKAVQNHKKTRKEFRRVKEAKKSVPNGIMQRKDTKKNKIVSKQEIKKKDRVAPSKNTKKSRNASDIRMQKKAPKLNSKAPSMTRFVDFFDEKGPPSVELLSKDQLLVEKINPKVHQKTLTTKTKPQKVQRKGGNPLSNQVENQNQNSKFVGSKTAHQKNLESGSKRSSKYHYKHLKKNRNSKMETREQGPSSNYLRSYKSPISRKSMLRMSNQQIVPRDSISIKSVSKPISNFESANTHKKRIKTKNSVKQISVRSIAKNKNFQFEQSDLGSNFDSYSKQSSQMNYRNSGNSNYRNLDSHVRSEVNNYVYKDRHKKTKSNFEFEAKNILGYNNQGNFAICKIGLIEKCF